MTISTGIPWVDTTSPAYGEDPYSQLAPLIRDGHDFAVSDRGIECLTFSAARAMLADEDHLRPPLVTAGATPLLERFERAGKLRNMAPADHTRVRRVMARAFGLKSIRGLEEVMETVATELAAGLTNRVADFVADFTHQYPIYVLCRFIGIPGEDIPTFAAASKDMGLAAAEPIEPFLDRIDHALATLEDYVSNLVDKRAKEPTDDFVSQLHRAQAFEGRLSRDEVVWGIVNLIYAGHDTTRAQLAQVLRALAPHPSIWERLRRSPDTIKAAVTEGIRLHPAVQMLDRVVMAPVEIEGVGRLPVGTRVCVNLIAASRDPVAFPDPEKVILERDNEYDLVFGWGPRYCLGHNLARTEMEIALRVLLDLFEEVQPNGPVSLVDHRHRLGGPAELPLRFGTRSEVGGVR